MFFTVANLNSLQLANESFFLLFNYYLVGILSYVAKQIRNTILLHVRGG